MRGRFVMANNAGLLSGDTLEAGRSIWAARVAVPTGSHVREMMLDCDGDALA